MWNLLKDFLTKIFPVDSHVVVRSYTDRACVPGPDPPPACLSAPPQPLGKEAAAGNLVEGHLLHSHPVSTHLGF